MKKYISIILKSISVILIIIYGCSHFSPASPRPAPQPQYLIDDMNNIIGTFVNENDPDWVLTFSTNGKCYWYDKVGTLEATYSYTITNTTPQCGLEVDVDESHETDYLQLTDDSTRSTDCYAINGISTVLSIRPLGGGRLLVFNKQSFIR